MNRPGWLPTWLRLPHWRRATVALALGLAALAFLGGSQIVTEVRENRAQQQATVQADRAQREQREAAAFAAEVFSRCATDQAVAVALGRVCDRAAQKATEPTPRPEPGRGITGTDLIDGRLVVRYSDGSSETVGQVVGPGGPGGPPGRGITDVRVVDGQLLVVFSDGEVRDLGTIVGDAGEDGADGRGIASTDTVDGRLIVTYTDGTTQDAGPLPEGPQGEPGADSTVPGPAGPPGKEGPPCPEGEERATVTYASGQTGTACVQPPPPEEPPG